MANDTDKLDELRKELVTLPRELQKGLYITLSGFEPRDSVDEKDSYKSVLSKISGWTF